MNPKTKNLLVRTVVGAVYVALMIAGVFIFPLMTVLLCLVTCLGIVECSRLVSGPVDRLLRVLLIAASVAQFAVILGYGLRKSTFFYNAEVNTLIMFCVVALLALVGLIMIPSIAELFRYRGDPHQAHQSHR